jgi:beta-D-xylosidase 4
VSYARHARLGYFDPPEDQPYRQLGWSDVSTPSAGALALTAASSGIVLLKNDGLLPIKNSTIKNVAVVGPWAQATTQMQGNYAGIAPLLVSPAQGLTNAGFKVTAVQGTAISTTSTSGFAAALAAAASADLIVFAGGIDDSIEAEAMDRTTIAWPGNQLQLIGELGALGKPLVVLQMGGGQVDSSSLKANSTVRHSFYRTFSISYISRR